MLDLVMIIIKRQSGKKQRLQAKTNKKCFYYGQKNIIQKIISKNQKKNSKIKNQ